jgi:type II secretory pathway predicted ATPase ExeA
MATAIPYAFYASTSQSAVQPVPKSKPLNYPVPQISERVKMDSTQIQAENIGPAILVEIPVLTTSATASTIQDHIPASLWANGLTEIEAQNTPVIADAAENRAAKENVLDMPIVEDKVVEWPEVDTVKVEANMPPVTAASEKKPATDLLSFYKLKQQPFDVTPDPAFLYYSPSHREALTSVKEGIEHFRGFMVLVAEPGMGKTTLLNKLMDDLGDSAQVVFLFQTQCNSRELLCFILNELEVDHTGMDVVAMHRALNQTLLEEMLRGRRFVLIVDEAQNLQEPVLETIRLLSDFETTHSKLIQIILAGQPQLAETLMMPSLVQLRQRISVLSSLKLLSAAQTAEYVDHRLRASGWSGDNNLFTREAIARIAESTEGIPRRINNLCFNALLEGFHRGLHVIGADIVKAVTEKLNLEALVRRPQTDAPSRQFAAPAEPVSMSQPTRGIATALNIDARQYANSKH